MIRSIEIRNFRCFEHLRLDDLARINLLVGDNASGKTALLEALFLVMADSPEAALRARSWRLGDNVMSGAAKDLFRDIFIDLFFRFDWTNRVTIDLDGPSPYRRSLSIAAQEGSQLTLALGQAETPTATITAPLSFNWRQEGAPEREIRPKIAEGGLVIDRLPEPPVTVHFFTVGQSGLAEQNARYFSSLSKIRQEDVLITALREHYPFIDDLSVEIFAGRPMLAASLAGFERKIPLGAVSHGPSRLATMLLAMASSPGSICLIDEIESGFYHEKLQGIWKTLHGFAERFDVQLFASTHSFECVEAAVHAVGERQDEILLLRARREAERNTIQRVTGEALSAAIEHAYEVR
jgi:energy-coupling factor transporter ATP-binding protein EcfA2